MSDSTKITITAIGMCLFVGGLMVMDQKYKYHDKPIAACEAEHDLKRSESCEMVAVVKGAE